MDRRRPLFASSIATKLLIGITGLYLAFYLVLHIAGNLLVFLGRDTFNAYSHMLISNPAVPAIEVTLLLAVLVHAYKAVTVTLSNRRARPVAYVQKNPAGPPSRKTRASSTMILSGIWLAAFIIIHVRAFKYGPEYEVPGTPEVRDLYRLEMENFANPLTVGFYVLSMAIVGSHLWHGITSSLQSLGIDVSRWSPRALAAGKAVAAAIAAAFAFIAVWAFATGGGL